MVARQLVPVGLGADIMSGSCPLEVTPYVWFGTETVQNGNANSSPTPSHGFLN